MINTIKDQNNNVLAIIIKSTYDKSGISFFTPDDYSQQLAYMHHPAGHVIIPHIHNEIKREVFYTKEVLVIKKGKLRCDFYSNNQQYLESQTIETGDVILLVSGGHGFECIEETEMFEIKQGPYESENDKVRFKPHNFN